MSLAHVWEALAQADLAGVAMVVVVCAAVAVGRRLRRASAADPRAWRHGTSDGVPLGLSRDYDELPYAVPPGGRGRVRAIACMLCDQLHADGERLMSNGSHVLAVMCRRCREQGRARWVAEHGAPLPQATATIGRSTR